MSDEPIYLGNQGPIKTRTKIRWTPQNGYETEVEYKGNPENMQSVINTLQQDNASIDYQASHPAVLVATIAGDTMGVGTGNISGTGNPQDEIQETWRLTMTELSKDLKQLPYWYDEESEENIKLLHKAFIQIDSDLEDGEIDTTSETYPNQFESEIIDKAEEYLDLKHKGTDNYREFAPVVIHITVFPERLISEIESSSYTDNVLRQSSENPIPLSATASNFVPSGYKWIKLHPEVETSRGETTITQYYEGAESMSTIIYPEQ